MPPKYTSLGKPVPSVITARLPRLKQSDITPFCAVIPPIDNNAKLCKMLVMFPRLPQHDIVDADARATIPPTLPPVTSP